jgi:hypothetical protein
VSIYLGTIILEVLCHVLAHLVVSLRPSLTSIHGAPPLSDDWSLLSDSWLDIAARRGGGKQARWRVSRNANFEWRTIALRKRGDNRRLAQTDMATEICFLFLVCGRSRSQTKYTQLCLRIGLGADCRPRLVCCNLGQPALNVRRTLVADLLAPFKVDVLQTRTTHTQCLMVQFNALGATFQVELLQTRTTHTQCLMVQFNALDATFQVELLQTRATHAQCSEGPASLTTGNLVRAKRLEKGVPANKKIYKISPVDQF